MTSTTMRVLVTGSRSWMSHESVWAALDAVAQQWAGQGGKELVVVHGGAMGVDSFAQSWVFRFHREFGPDELRVVPEVHRPDWIRHGRRRAGLVRSQEMVDRGADVCLAFLAPCASSCRRPEAHHSHGATACRDMARAAGIRVVELFEGIEVCPSCGYDEGDHCQVHIEPVEVSE